MSKRKGIIYQVSCFVDSDTPIEITGRPGGDQAVLRFGVLGHGAVGFLVDPMTTGPTRLDDLNGLEALLVQALAKVRTAKTAEEAHLVGSAP